MNKKTSWFSVISAALLLSSLLSQQITLIPLSSLSLFGVSFCATFLFFTLLTWILSKFPPKNLLPFLGSLFIGGAIALGILLLSHQIILLFPPFPLQKVLECTLLLIGFLVGFHTSFNSPLLQRLGSILAESSSASPPHKTLLLHPSALLDERLLGLVQSGLVNDRLCLPHSTLLQLQALLNHPQEEISRRAKFAFRMIEQMENLPHLHLHTLQDVSSIPHNIDQHLGKLCLQKETELVTAEIGEPHHFYGPDVHVINLHQLAASLRTSQKEGETLEITITRTGNEPKQGVGYLEDGTMVVVNGGGAMIGEKAKVQVIGKRRTKAGLMIFTNLLYEEDSPLYMRRFEEDPRILASS